MRKRARGESRKSVPAMLCRILGTLMLIVLVLFCLPLTLPRVFGWHIYTVVSGSMEPSIPVGSLLYIRQAEPQDMEAGDVIAYYGGTGSGAVITHRVVENRVVMGELITKGDAISSEKWHTVFRRREKPQPFSPVPTARRRRSAWWLPQCCCTSWPPCWTGGERGAETERRN